MKKQLADLSISVLISAFCTILFLSGYFATWQDRLSDQLFAPRPARKDIAIIAIDDKSIQSIGRFPWNRSVYAQLLEKLGKNPAVVALDVSFPETSESTDDEALVDAFRKAGNIVLPIEAERLQSQFDVISASGLLLPIPAFRNVTSAGIVNTETDTDGVNRRIPVHVIAEDGKPLTSFSETVLNLYRQQKNLPPLQKIPAEEGAMRINFIGGPGSFRTYSFADVLNHTIPADTFKDRIVLIGATALDLHDNQLTPTSGGVHIPGVEIHANAIQTMMDQTFLREESVFQTILAILTISIILAIALSFFGILRGSISVIVLLVLCFWYAMTSFDRGIIRNLVFPPLTVLLVFIAETIYQYVVTNKQKRFIRKALSHYLSESVMRAILMDPKKLSLGGERKEITVLFSDIAGFTTISEKLAPEKLSELLNHYLTQMTNIVFKYNGVLDKYIGDAVMAFWGAPVPDPDQAFHACKVSLEMQQEIRALRDEWAHEGIPSFDVRIGVNTGEMVVGNMGSDVRFDYTLLGDNVNLGSRLEGINKEYGTHIVISESTFEKVKDRVVARRLDTVAVKGKAEGIVIYELRGLGKPSSVEQTFLDGFEKARELYQRGKFKLSKSHFSHLAISNRSDHSTHLYISRCEELIARPPANWDGVFHAKSK